MVDKAALILDVLAAGPASLSDLAATTKLPRPTAHRLARALEHHGLVDRDEAGRFVLGVRISELAACRSTDPLLPLSGPILTSLRDLTGESAQLYQRQGEVRVCVATADRESGLRDTVPVGAVLSMQAGSAAQVLLAWETPDEIDRGLQRARFDAASLSIVRRRGWAQSVAERESGVASVSAPVRGPSGRVIAAISVSGPIDRLTRAPGRSHAASVVAAGGRLSEAVQRVRLPGLTPGLTGSLRKGLRRL